MAKGRVVFKDGGSRVKTLLSLKYPFPVDPGACIEVGEGKTSVSREGGSFRESVFQIPLLHVNEPEPVCPRPVPAVVAAWAVQLAASPVGVVG